MNEKEYTIVQDNDTHRYIIPWECFEEWCQFCEIPEDDERSWGVPEWAEIIDGGRVIFTSYRIT